MELPVIYHPDGFVFREMQPADADAIHEINQDPLTQEFTRLNRQQTAADIKSWLGYYPHYRRHGFGLWAIEHIATQTLTGLCGLRSRSDLQGLIDISYRMHPNWRGQGIASSAIDACLGFGLKKLGLKKILAQVHVENSASLHLLKGKGFFETQNDGTWIDLWLSKKTLEG